MPLHPATDEWAQCAYLQAARSRIIEDISRDCAADTLTFIFPRHHSVQEDDGVRCEVVLTDAGESVIDPRFVPARHGIISDCHAHGRPLCQTAIRVRFMGKSSLVDDHQRQVAASPRATAHSYAADQGGHRQLLVVGEM
jgi:hypothetical protein